MRMIIQLDPGSCNEYVSTQKCVSDTGASDKLKLKQKPQLVWEGAFAVQFFRLLLGFELFDSVRSFLFFSMKKKTPSSF